MRFSKFRRSFIDLISQITREDARILLDVVMKHLLDRSRVEDLYFSEYLLPTDGPFRCFAEQGLEVAQLALRMAAAEPYVHQVDADLIIVGGLLHDLGGLHDTAVREGIIEDETVQRLRSPISRASEIVSLAATRTCALGAGATSYADVRAVQHIIESKDDGPVSVPPQCMEAVLIKAARSCSVTLRPMLKSIEGGEVDREGWVTPPTDGSEPVWHAMSVLDRRGGCVSPAEIALVAGGDHV